VPHWAAVLIAAWQASPSGAGGLAQAARLISGWICQPQHRRDNHPMSDTRLDRVEDRLTQNDRLLNIAEAPM
jgi:hypothetical protein